MESQRQKKKKKKKCQTKDRQCNLFNTYILPILFYDYHEILQNIVWYNYKYHRGALTSLTSDWRSWLVTDGEDWPQLRPLFVFKCPLLNDSGQN